MRYRYIKNTWHFWKNIWLLWWFYYKELVVNIFISYNINIMKKILFALLSAVIWLWLNFWTTNAEDIELSTNRPSPSTSQFINLTIETDDDYVGKLTFSTKYRNSSSSSWTSISSQTSSTYFSDYSNTWSNGYYRMTSSDDGEVTLTNLVKFKKKGYYRIYVKDTDWNQSYIQFDVDQSDSSSDWDLQLSVSPSNPDTNEWMKLKIETDDDYVGKINFTKFQYRSSSSSSRSNISRTSSTYVSDYSSHWSNGYYKMTSSDDGEKTISNFIKFKKKWYYRIVAEDVDSNVAYVQFYVGESSSSSSSDLELSVSPSSPDTNEWVKLKIKTDDDYVGKINFTKFQYKSSSSSSRSSISRTSSTYVSDYSTEWSNGYYRMTSSDDGEKTISKFIKFKKKGYYKITAEDTDGNTTYVQISVDQGGSSSDWDLQLSISPSKPDTNEWVKLTIETDDDYVGKINFTKLQYRSSSSASRSSISRTSSTYVSDYSTEWSNGYYRMTSSDDGEKTISKFIKFKKKWYYRITAEDTDENIAYVQIPVDVSSSSSSDDDITLSTNKKSPSTNQFVNLTINTDDDYVGKLTFSAKYRSTSSSSWTSISNITSSTYFSDYSDEWEDWYYKMKSSDDGEKTLKNIVKFRKKGYYRIYVKDADWNQNYIQFAVWINGSSSSEESDVDGFTKYELSKVKETYESWESMIAQMQRQYPHLKKSTYWKTLSNNFYNDMKDVVRNKSPRDFDDYDDFKSAFDDWYEYTMRNV